MLTWLTPKWKLQNWTAYDLIDKVPRHAVFILHDELAVANNEIRDKRHQERINPIHYVGVVIVLLYWLCTVYVVLHEQPCWYTVFKCCIQGNGALAAYSNE